MVGQRILDPLILVRFQVSQPNFKRKIRAEISKFWPEPKRKIRIFYEIFYLYSRMRG